MREHSTVYLAWQAPETRDWHVVGALTQASKGYDFHYTKGALVSESFVPFSGMENLNNSYHSDELFPLFNNRLLSQKRPEYPSFIKWLGLSESEATPVNILARSGGIRNTDQLQMFRKIEVDESGLFTHYFFLHGLSYLPQQAQERIDNLLEGEKLLLCKDCQNPYDSEAVFVRANHPPEIVGFCPRYLARDISKLMDTTDYLNVTVEKITSDAPINYRLMCKIEGKLNSDNFEQFTDQSEYQFIV
ncbi:MULTISPECIES: HIRAN domain-containing protein [Shewanella]|uniref:HIRAN domain-containing protein n=1 Tax=Shewanella TaxID=22 RepID=UPI00201AEA65|nr:MULTISPECIES: HIRAN domain-containing protein [Shewanella]